MNQETLRALLHGAVEVMPQGLVITDAARPDNPIVYCNRGFEELTGFSSEEILNRNCRFLQGPDTQPEELDGLRRAIAASVPHTVVLRNYRREGRPFWNALSVTPIRDEGTVRHFVGVQTDISAIKEIEQQLLRAQKLETVGLLTGGVAHDFNNILTVINGFTEIALSSLSAEDVEMREMMSEVLDAGIRGAALTRQLLGFTRTQPAPRTMINLNSVITAADRIIRRLAGSAIGVVLELENNLPSVSADSSQMEQVIFNLVTNAKDATRAGGVVTIRTRADSRSGKGEPRVILQVADTGTGMTEEIRARIFEPLFTTKSVGRGTGLGLATVQRIVDAHRGTIDVESEVGRGTTFSVSLPASKEGATKADVAGLRSSHRGTEVVILVERDDSVRKLVVRSLQTHGYTVLEAARGRDALETVGAHAGPLHLMILDIETDDVPISEMLREMREMRAETFVLLLSGTVYDDRLRELIEQAGIPALTKPFTPEELATRIRLVLAGALPLPTASGTSS